MLYIGTRKQIQEYRDSPAINQSTLKDLQYGLDSFLKKQKEEKSDEIFIRGSAVDCILTGTEEDFFNEFYISVLDKKPSETEMNIVEFVFNRVCHIENFGQLSDYPNVIEEAVETINWQANWKMETRVNKISSNPLCLEYFEDLRQAQGKSVLSLSQYGEVMAVVESLKNNKLTKPFFDRDYLKSAEKIVTLYQVPIYFKYKEKDCKALLDIIVLLIDENNNIKEIQVVDLKTMSGNTLNFLENVLKFRYDIQAAFYLKAIENVDKTFFSDLGYNLMEDTVINPFLFAVESITNPGAPLLYGMTENLFLQGWQGTEDIYLNNRLIKKGKKGFEELLDEYTYYQNNNFTTDILLENRNGLLFLDLDKIV